jgi:type VI secretion system protein ImpB
MALSDSATSFIKRNRPPRVQIAYADPYNSEKQIELPFVMAVLSDLSGNASAVEKAPVAERKLVPVSMDNLDEVMGRIAPGVSLKVPNKLEEGASNQLGVTLNFTKMEDFSPGEIARQVPALRTLLEARQQLANLQRYMDGKTAAEEQLRQLLADPALMAALDERRAQGTVGGEG